MKTLSRRCFINNWEKCEKNIARKLKGIRCPGSGNGTIPGDILNNKYIIEVKETSKDYLTFNLSWIDKLWQESKKTIIKNRIPIFIVELGNGFKGVLVIITSRSQIEDSKTYLSIKDKKSIRITEETFNNQFSFWYQSFMIHCMSFEEWELQEL